MTSLFDLIVGGKPPEEKPQENPNGEQPGSPVAACVVCARQTMHLCGMCLRLEEKRVPLCEYMDNQGVRRPCQAKHAKEAHTQPRLAETDPHWKG